MLYKQFFAIAFCMLPVLLAAQYDFTKARENIIKQVDSNRIPSISVAVVRKNQIIWEESFGYADREAKRKATVHTPYYIASVTKLMTATCILQLLNEKKIVLDAPANNYLQAKLESTRWDAADITIRRLLQHTSGLTSFNLVYANGSSMEPGRVSLINRYALPFWKPGTRFDYSNLGYTVLAKLIEDVSGKSFGDYLQENIFKRAGMQDSYLPIDASHAEEAKRYTGDPARTLAPFSITASTGASGVFSSVHDLALLAMQFLKTRIGLLPSALIDTLKYSTLETAPGQHGIAIGQQADYFGFAGWLSQGGTSEAQAWFQLIPSEEMAVIVLSNTGGGNCQSVILDVFSQNIPGFAEKLTAPKNKPAPAQSTSPVAAQPAFPAGNYNGFIKTYKGNISLQAVLTDSATMDLSIENMPMVHITAPRWRNGRLYFETPADLGVSEAGAGPYKLKFELSLDNNRLTGAALTTAINDPATPNLPFWVELVKK